jgi:hypothetical protein
MTIITAPARRRSRTSLRTITKTLYAKAMMEAMNGNCSNIAILLNKYMSFCQQLDRDADPRLKAWVACLRAGQQKCGGPGLP